MSGTSGDKDDKMGNFFHQHVRETVLILEEGNLSHQQFPSCNMLLPWRALSRRNLASDQCAKGEERNSRRLTEEELRDSLERAIHSYGEPLETVISLKHIGRVMIVGDYNWTAVAGNLRKARKSWMWMKRILI